MRQVVLRSRMVLTLLPDVARCWRAWPRLLVKQGLVVAVSGGVDSVVLLDVMSTLAREQGVHLTVAHAHHGLRDGEADADEALVREISVRLGWPCVTARLDVRGELERTKESIEMTARRLRHRFLARTARDVGAGAVALAHHADDQVELFLLRLFRGAGGEGLGGMSPEAPSAVDPGILLVRPLLGITKEALLAHATARGLEFREDASNRDISIPRNKARQVLLPWMREQVGPHLDRVLLRTAELIRADAECVDQLAEAWWASRRRRPFARLATAVQRAVVRRQLWELGVPVEFELVERLRRAESDQSAAGGRILQRDEKGEVRLVVPAGKFRDGDCHLHLGDRGSASLGGTRVEWRQVLGGSRRRGPPRESIEQFDAASLGSGIILRFWRPGDRFRPLGMARRAKLQDLFTNRKIPAAERRNRLVATTEAGEIFWVEGFPPGEAFKVGAATRRRVIWSWRRSNAGEALTG